MSKIIRIASPADSSFIAPIMLQAMEDLAKKFVNSTNIADAIPLFERFIKQKNNIYSFENTLVCLKSGVIVGSITAYDGAQVEILRQPFLDYIQLHYKFDTTFEKETEAGEFYLDTVSVAPNQQGQGIGAMLIQAMAERAKTLGHQRIALLVDKTNPQAKRLYQRLGFKVLGEKRLLGENYEHLVLEQSLISL